VACKYKLNIMFNSINKNLILIDKSGHIDLLYHVKFVIFLNNFIKYTSTDEILNYVLMAMMGPQWVQLECQLHNRFLLYVISATTLSTDLKTNKVIKYLLIAIKINIIVVSTITKSVDR